MKIPTHNEMVAAMQNDDSRYDGKFFVCVKSTGIYCLPSCKAKRPLLKNVTFYATREEASEAGFRGCKRCKSEFYPDVTPDWLGPVLTFMRSEARIRITEEELANRAGIDISTIRRYFKSYMNTTPMTMHRNIRLQHAHTLLKRGSDYLTAAYESGFESSSGFRDAFAKRYGYPPSTRKLREVTTGTDSF